MDWLNPWKEEKSDVWWRQNSPPSNHHQDDAEVLDLVMPMYNLIEHSSNYSKTTGSLWFCSKDEATSFNADIDNFKWDYDNFRSFKYKVKLLENTEVDGENGILRNAAIAHSLKYLSNFWRSIQIPLIYCKVESKLRWTKYFFCLQLVLIMLMLILITLFLLSRTQNYMLLLSLYQQKIIKKYQNFLEKDLKDQFSGMNIKQKGKIKIRQMNIDVFWDQTLLELIDYLF